MMAGNSLRRPRMTQMTPDQIDNVESASAPLTSDPSLSLPEKPVSPPEKRGNTQAKLQASDENAIGLRARAYQKSGVPMALAYQMAQQDVLEAKQSVLDSMNAPRTSQPAAPPAPPSPPKLTPDELRAKGQNPYKEPGPRTVDGTPIRQPEALTTEADAQAYNTRTPVTHENAMQAGADAAYLPSERDKAMMERGLFPVYAPDGSVSYSVGTGSKEMMPRDDGRGIPGAPGRLGPRADLQETDPSKPGFVLRPVRGPTGTNYVYRQNDAAKAKQAAYMDRRQVSRISRATGIDPSTLAAMKPEDRVVALDRSRDQDYNARNATWKAQAMLAGGRPTGGIGGSKALTNAWLTLPQDQRESSMRYMLPGGALAASVDARQLDQAAALAGKSILGAFAQNPGLANMQQAQQAKIENELPVDAHADAERLRNKGVLPAKSAAGQRVLQQLNDEVIGMFATTAEINDAVNKAVAAGIPRADAEAHFAPRRRSYAEWLGVGAAPATPSAPAPGADPRAWGGGA